MPEKKRKSRRREEERGVDEEEDAAPLSLNTFAAAAEDALVDDALLEKDAALRRAQELIDADERRLAAQDDDEDDDEDDDDDDEEEEEESKRQVLFRPGVDEMGEGEELDYDPTVYNMYHKFHTEWPALSFDILRDSLGDGRRAYPHTMYIVAGSQADKSDKNKITLMKLSELHRTKGDGVEKKNEDDEDEDEDEDEDIVDPILLPRTVPHPGAVNRIRSMPQLSHIVTSFSSNGSVLVYDLQEQLAQLDGGGASNKKKSGSGQPIFSFDGHADEGYAIDWSPVARGSLLSGDCRGYIHKWAPREGGWDVDVKAFKGHTSSVEDLQWSPYEAAVFASAACDGTVKIWDANGNRKPQLSFDAHPGVDVNVITWSRVSSFLLASGADDGSFKVWDLRTLAAPLAQGKQPGPSGHFKWMTSPVTSIEFHPTDESVLAVSSEDAITIWDLALEEEDGVEADVDLQGVTIPAQLLFEHRGQKHIKELHFHPQIENTIVSTAADGFNIFQPYNLEQEVIDE